MYICMHIQVYYNISLYGYIRSQIFTLAGAPAASALVVVVVVDVTNRKVAVVKMESNKMVTHCIYKSFEHIFTLYSSYFGTGHFVVDLNHGLLLEDK